MTEISFPGIGIEPFEVDRVAFRITFGEKVFPVYWYGIIITCGIIFAFLYAYFRTKREGLKFDDLLDIGIWTVILGVIGARLYYVLTKLEDFVPEPFNFIDFIRNMLNLRGGGLAIYGGIIGGILAIILVTRKKKINTLVLTDAIAPGVMIAQALGRWGNFFNAEAHGGIVSESSPLYFIRMGLRDPDELFSVTKYWHPTFLYESLWNVTGFVIINILYKKKKFNGQISCMYLAWYGFGRMFIEGLRTDSLYIFGNVRISQLVGFLCFIGFGALLVIGILHSKKFDPQNKFDALLIPFSMTYCEVDNISDVDEAEKPESIEEVGATETAEELTEENETSYGEEATENISEEADKETEETEETEETGKEAENSEDKETEEEKSGEDN